MIDYKTRESVDASSSAFIYEKSCRQWLAKSIQNIPFYGFLLVLNMGEIGSIVYGVRSVRTVRNREKDQQAGHTDWGFPITAYVPVERPTQGTVPVRSKMYVDLHWHQDPWSPALLRVNNPTHSGPLPVVRTGTVLAQLKKQVISSYYCCTGILVRYCTHPS